jgi:hypothetical protein
VRRHLGAECTVLIKMIPHSHESCTLHIAGLRAQLGQGYPLQAVGQRLVLAYPPTGGKPPMSSRGIPSATHQHLTGGLSRTQSTDTKGKAPPPLSKSDKGKKPASILSNKRISLENCHNEPTKHFYAYISDKAATRLLISLNIYLRVLTIRIHPRLPAFTRVAGVLKELLPKLDYGDPGQKPAEQLCYEQHRTTSYMRNKYYLNPYRRHQHNEQQKCNNHLPLSIATKMGSERMKACKTA